LFWALFPFMVLYQPYRWLNQYGWALMRSLALGPRNLRVQLLVVRTKLIWY
jgi:hypothetical protein